MKVSLLSENLQKKILFANHAISTRSQLPILLNFLITAEKGKLSISATDLEIGIITEIPAKIEKEGSVTLPAKTFTELIATIPLKKITLETAKEGLELTGEKTKAVFQTSPTEEFPKLYEEKGGEIITLEKEDAGKDFLKVVFSASQDTEKPVLSGVLIKEGVSEGGKGFVLVATDGYRLSLKKHALQGSGKNPPAGGPDEEISIIVPARVIRELIQMAKETPGSKIKVFISKEKNQIIFSQEDTVLVGRLIEGEFPNFERIIPTDFSTKSTFERQDLQRAIKAGYVFSRQTAGIIKISVKKDKIIVSANAPSVGKNTVEIEAKTTGEENEIAFNARYVLDLLSNTTSEMMTFEMTGPLNPGVFKEIDDPSFMHLIMPIRVSQEE